MPRLAFSGAMRAVFLVAAAAPLVLQWTGEATLQIFVHDHCFIEPFVALGDYHQPAAGNSGVATLIVGTVYRLAIVF